MAEYEWSEDYDHLVLIGIQGALGAGKTTIRKVLVSDMSFTAMSMADPIKVALMSMGATRSEMYGEDKPKPNELWGGKTNRFAMQTLGTEWGRQTIQPDIWVDCIRRSIDTVYKKERERRTDHDFQAHSLRIVIDDIRFWNEMELIHQFGGSLWTVRRPSVEYAEYKQRMLRRFGWSVGRLLGIHESERWWPMAPADLVIDNNGVESQLIEAVKANYGVMYR